MPELVTSACTLGFAEHEFIGFFGEISPLDEDAHSYTYTVNHDGLRLEFTLFPIEGDVYADIFRDGVPNAIVKLSLRGCTHSRFTSFGSSPCLEVGRPPIPTTDADAPISRGLRLIVNPHIKLTQINEEG